MRLAITIMLTFCLAISVQAQDPDSPYVSDPPNENAANNSKNGPIGFDFGLYSGYGWNSQGCSQCYQEQWTGGWLFGLKLGVLYPTKFAAGVIIQYWMAGTDLWKTSDNIEYKRNSIFIHLAGYYFPLNKPNFFLKGSAGINIFNFTPSDSVRLDNGRQTLGTLSHVGPGFSFGLGYAFRITNRVYFTPAIDYLYHPFSQLKGEGPNQYVSGTNGSNNLYISLGFNVRDLDFLP